MQYTAVEDYHEWRKKQKKHKYNAQKSEVDGQVFDSQAEAKRYKQLVLLQRSGLISDLQRQPKFELLPKFVDNSGEKHRAIHYVADFTYQEGGLTIVEDVKGMETPEFKLKLKLFLHRYPNVVFRLVK